MINQSNFQNMQSEKQLDPAMFSLAESDFHYLVTVDIPTIPTLGTKILTSKDELTVVGNSENSHEKQTIFRMFPQNKGVKTFYVHGVLYMLLPKVNLDISTTCGEVASA